VLVTPAVVPADLAGLLDERGWTAEAATEVMTAELGPVLRAAPPATAVARVDPVADEAWVAAYRPGTPGGLPEPARALLANHDTVGFASVRDDDRCIAIARVTVDERWAGLSCVEVAPDRRGEGLGAQVSAAALRWSVARGARHATLQVMVGNTAARALYDRLGFAVHHDYVYRSAPDR
jgi:ribosomal protein S18 acetylase RimI-like enzyme